MVDTVRFDQAIQVFQDSGTTAYLIEYCTGFEECSKTGIGNLEIGSEIPCVISFPLIPLISHPKAGRRLRYQWYLVSAR